MPANVRRHIPGDVGSEVLRVLIEQYNNLRAWKLAVGVGAQTTGGDTRPNLAAADTLGETTLVSCTEANGIEIDDIQFAVSGAVTANDTNFRTFTLKKRTAAGADGGTIALFTTETTGSGGTGNLTAFLPISLRSSSVGTGGTALSVPLLLEQGESITVASTVDASGVAVAGGTFIVHGRTKHDEIVLTRQPPLRPSRTDGLQVPT